METCLNLQYSGLHRGQIAFEILQISFNKKFPKKGGGSNCQWSCARRAFGPVVLVVYGTSHKTSKMNAFLNAFLLQVILFEALTALLSDANTSIEPNYASF